LPAALARVRQAGITSSSRDPWLASTPLTVESTSHSCGPIGRLAAASSSPTYKHPTATLGLVEATADEKKRAGRVAMLASRTNTMLSIPMLYAMTSTHFY